MSESITTDRGRLNEWNWAAILWRRKWIVIATLIVFVAVTEAVTATMQRIYSTSATMVVAQPGRLESFDTTQTDEEAARSYSDVLASPNFAARVASLVGGGATGASIASAVSIQPVAQTQLMTITVEAPNPARAKLIADTYASIFVQYAPRLAAQTKATVTLADRAPLPASPVRPKPPLYGLVAAIVGLAAGLALAFLRERFDVRIRSGDDLPDWFDLPILADIPQRKRDADSGRAFAEAFRLLRTTLRMTTLGSARSIAITSWAAGEGKTTVASQLALSLAASGTSTLIVDGDVQRSGLTALLTRANHEPLEPGLSDYLLGSSGIDDATHRTRPGALDLMPPGRKVPDLSTVLETPRGQTAFAELVTGRDSVIVDCPPLAVGADASTIASHVDGVIMVVDLRTATTTGLQKAVRQLDAANARIMGVVLNRDRQSARLTYYGYDNKSNGKDRSAGGLVARARRRTVSS